MSERKTVERKTGARKTSGKEPTRNQGSSSPKKNAPENQRGRVVRLIRALPSGEVSSYGAVARAAGWTGAARQVVRILQQVPGLPWHRVVGAGGAIRLRGENGAEQKFRLRMEGVTFRGARVDMKRHEFHFPKTVRSTQKLKIRAQILD